MGQHVIRDLDGPELVRGCALLADALGFGERDALPPWLVQTCVAEGGIALGAFDGGTLVGFCAAIPGRAGELFCCGLAVAATHRRQGVARRLKLAERDRALALGIRAIRWTADPLAAPALGLYLAGLGGRLIEYGADRYADVRPSPVPPDDVTIVWTLAGRPARGDGPAAAVEIPFDHRALSEPERLAWRLRVRRAMCRAVERGSVGTGMAFDRRTRRAWVLFSAPEPRERHSGSEALLRVLPRQ